MKIATLNFGHLASGSSSNRIAMFKYGMLMCIAAALLFALGNVNAADGAELADAAAKMEGLIKGNLGKLAAFTMIAVGAIVAAIKKDWTWFFGAVILSIGVGILVAMVNSSFTAVI